MTRAISTRLNITTTNNITVTITSRWKEHRGITTTGATIATIEATISAEITGSSSSKGLTIIGDRHRLTSAGKTTGDTQTTT